MNDMNWLPLLNQALLIVSCFASVINGLLLIYIIGKMRMVEYWCGLTKAVQDDS